MEELEQKLLAARDRLAFLVEYAVSTPQEMRLNNMTFQWFERLPAVFADSHKIIDDKQAQYEDALKVRTRLLIVYET